MYHPIAEGDGSLDRHINKGGMVDAVYLNFAKAFDTVPHQRLLIKLEGYGVKGKLLEWFKNFLLGRR